MIYVVDIKVESLREVHLQRLCDQRQKKHQSLLPQYDGGRLRVIPALGQAVY